MSGLSGLVGRIKKCQKVFSLMTKIPKRSVVYMDENREILWEEGVEYNAGGVLVVPLPMTVDQWEQNNINNETTTGNLF